MEASTFAQILSDKNVTDLKKLGYKYPQVDMKELIALFKASIYRNIPLSDFSGQDIVYMESMTQVRMSAAKLLLKPQMTTEAFGLKAMEDEIASTLTIENIDYNRDSVRKILQGYAPSDEQETRIYGMKKGLEFIADPSNAITEDNLFLLYDMTVGQHLAAESRLMPGNYYRHDTVFIVGQQVEHTGLPHEKLPEYMKRFLAFVREESAMNDLLKAAAIHFYMAYLHPYFDGNGRMARLLHLWFLRQQGYSSALFVPLSSYIERSRSRYYAAYTQAEENEKISHVLDTTPFLVYFIEHVYHKLAASTPEPGALEAFDAALSNGVITVKEKELWFFVLSAYGASEFSTKQLERDFGNAAYATIRGFVLKFTELNLLKAQRYGNKVRYSIAGS